MPSAEPRPLRVAFAHVFATGNRGHNGHGLLHIGLLPLVAGAEPLDWVINPERDFSNAVYQASKISKSAAKAAPTWAEQRAEIRAAFGPLDAVLVMDRAGERSPERQWLEDEVLAGLAAPPVCVALDDLLAFFLPQETLDDVEELKKQLLADEPWKKYSGYADSQPQLSWLLRAMRRALRRVLVVVLRAGPVAELPFPVLALLRAALAQAPRNPRPLRAFRLLNALAQQPDCCDEALPATATATTTTSQRQKYLLPRPPAVLGLAVLPHALLAEWLRGWHLRPDGVGEPEYGVQDDLTAEQMDAAFADLRRQAKADGHDLKPRPRQQEYAHFVANAFNKGGAYALEAGTGTGKTFGYLVPALEYLRRHPTAAVIVATSTKNLQDQMQAGELPALLPHDDKGRRTGRYAAIRTALLKGKNCYLCADALANQFFETFETGLPDWPRALAWLYLALRLRDTQGEIESVPRPIETLLGRNLGGLRPLVEAERHCRHGRGNLLDELPCVYKAHRLRAEVAHLVITNHHKLLSLPTALQERAQVLIVDEADRFPDNFRAALARTFSPHNLVAEVLVPLLGYDAPQAPRWAGGTRARPPAALLVQLAERLEVARQHFYREAAASDRPAASDDTAELAFELLAEAHIEALSAELDLCQQIAEAVAGTPLEADARTSTETAWLTLHAAREPVRQRRAVRAAQQALPGLAEGLHLAWNALLHLSQQFQPSGRELPELPFGPGDTHWMDALNWAAPGQPPRFRPVLSQLRQALPPLSEPLAAAVAQLTTVGQSVAAALLLAAEAEGREPTAEPGPDERLAARVTQIAARAQEMTAVLARLLAETPVPDFIPIVERFAEHDLLGWNLRRQPHCLWPYLVTTGPGGTALPGPAVDETSEAYALRRQAARLRLSRLPGEPAVPLYEAFRTVVFTSATLYVEDGLDYFRRLLDQPAAFAASARIGAAFDFGAGERIVAGLATTLPQYRSRMPPAPLAAWREAQCRLLLALIVALEGRTLVLFTSNDDLRFAADWLHDHLLAHDIELLRQNGASQWEIRRFARVPQSVLLGVDRFWTGVDFPGPTLAQVIVWRAPIPGLGDPLTSHRQRYLTTDTYWQHFGRPATRLKLRQGFGRLVRREKDQGAFVLLDARLGQPFMANLLQELPLACEHHFSIEALLAATVQQVLPLDSLRLGEEFKRRGLTLEKLWQLAAG